MSIALAFVIFTASMVTCLIAGKTMLIALVIGFFCFFSAACKRGYSAREVGKMAGEGAKESLVVVEILVLIGMLTGLWRSSGVITFFVYYGIKIITPHLFILITFLLCALLSYALGTSFGVAGTVGVIFIVLAKSGDVSLAITGGAILSGVYFGDRGSPVSSSGVLTAAVTHTNFENNVREMMKSAAIPMAICVAAYGALSYTHPIKTVDTAVMDLLSTDFHLSWLLLLPAVIVLVLPLFKVKIKITIFITIIVSFILGIAFQGDSVLRSFKYMIFGYTCPDPALGSILNGGGLKSMVLVCAILALSCSYSGIFRTTRMLNGMQHHVLHLMKKVGRFPATLITSIVLVALFCNQTIATVMTTNMVERMYIQGHGTRTELAMDIENSAIIVAAIVPWSLAVAVCYNIMGVGMYIIPWAFFLFLVPICWLFTKRFLFKPEKAKNKI